MDKTRETPELTVVVAEDEPLILNSLVKKIGAEIGYRVAGTAQDGKSALEAVDRTAPDLLVTDIQMPVMSGLELIRAVDAKYPDVVKVIVSGYNDFKYAQTALQFGVRDYLLKPVKKQQLHETLEKVRIQVASRSDRISGLLQGMRGQPSSPDEIARLVESYIRENYRRDINFDLIAQDFGFTASYLSRVFTRCIGENPSKYLISLRINEAKHLLRARADLSVKGIGELVGYTDQYHFSHIFKLVEGKSPAAFREAVRDAHEPET